MRVKIDLGYRVAYLLDDRDVAQRATSGVTRSNVDDVLASWGYARTRDGKWECTDILNAIDAVSCPVELVGAGSAY
jgi:hypothetical protein